MDAAAASLLSHNSILSHRSYLNQPTSQSISHSISSLPFFQSNFFAALDDSDNEGKAPAVAAKKKAAPKKEVIEPSKVENRA
jgi:indole-3-glycerol phosphate synthase